MAVLVLSGIGLLMNLLLQGLVARGGDAIVIDLAVWLRAGPALN